MTEENEDLELANEFEQMEAMMQQVEAGKAELKVLEPKKILFNNGECIIFMSSIKDLIQASKKDQEDYIREFYDSKQDDNNLIKLPGRIDSKDIENDGYYKVSFIIKYHDKDQTNANLINPYSKITLNVHETSIIQQGGDAVKYVENNEKCLEEYKLRLKQEEERKSLDQKIRERIDVIEKTAELTHPGSWSFGKSKNQKCHSEEVYELLIHFPEVNISNTNNLSHKINDIYVKLSFDKDINHVGVIYGCRGTMTGKEVSSGYQHSHLPGNSSFVWSKFCLGGSDTTTGSLVLGLSADKWNPDSLRSLLILLYSFISWESLEGGPHIRIETMLSRTSGFQPRRIYLDHVTIYRLFLDRIRHIPLKTEVNTKLKTTRIILDSENHSFLQNLKDIFPDQLVVINDGVENDYTRGNSYSEDLNGFKRHFNGHVYFKEEKRLTNVISSITEEEQEVPEESLRVASYIIKNIKTEVEKKINNYQLKMNML